MKHFSDFMIGKFHHDFLLTDFKKGNILKEMKNDQEVFYE